MTRRRHSPHQASSGRARRPWRELAPQERARVIEFLALGDPSTLAAIAQQHGALSVSLGTRERRGRLVRGGGLVLKFEVRSKVMSRTALQAPIPRTVDVDIPAATRSRARRALRVSFETDVVGPNTGSKAIGRALGAAPVIARDAVGEEVSGCLAARVQWGARSAWLGAAHVLTVNDPAPSHGAAGLRITSPTGEIERVVPHSCWRTGASGHMIDIGLALEVVPAASLGGSTASEIGDALAAHEVTPDRSYWMVPRNASRRELTFASWVPAGRMMRVGEHLVPYPPMLAFQGTSSPGDSGTSVVAVDATGTHLAGILVGMLDGRVVAISAQQALDTLSDLAGQGLRLAPLGMVPGPSDGLAKLGVRVTGRRRLPAAGGAGRSPARGRSRPTTRVPARPRRRP